MALARFVALNQSISESECSGVVRGEQLIIIFKKLVKNVEPYVMNAPTG